MTSGQDQDVLTSEDWQPYREQVAFKTDPSLAALLTSVKAFLKRFVRFGSESQAIAVALWIAHSWTVEACDTTLYLIVESPEKRAGKTRLLEAAELLVRNPWRAVETSEAALFRIIEAEKPTVLLDEGDAIFGKEAKLFQGFRALLNAGHRRGNPVPRVVGEGPKAKVQKFETFSPKAIAAIKGKVPDTVMDRGVVIAMQRKTPGEQVERFRRRDAESDAEPLRTALAAWAARAGLLGQYDNVPTDLNDRAAEGWEPLLEIADQAGGDWPHLARMAAVELHADQTDSESAGILLLRHIREELNGRVNIPTSDLLERLTERDDGPWAEWWGKAVGEGRIQGPAARLAKMLNPYKIKPHVEREGKTTFRGYTVTDFEGAFQRYLPPLPPESRHTVTAQADEQIPLESEGGEYGS